MSLAHAQSMKANTTYLIAPDAALIGKTLLFESGKNTILTSDFTKEMVGKVGEYDVVVSSVNSNVKNAYILDGEKFVFVSDESTVPPFRACLVGGEPSCTSIIILGPEMPDAIQNVEEMSSQTAGVVYNILGTRVGVLGNLHSLPKGLYIVNGKKIAVKN